VGIGQTVTISLWLNEPPSTANGTYGDRWQNMTIGIVRPDGQQWRLGPFSSDGTGRVVTSYIVTEVGKHSFWMTFGGQTLAGVNLAPGTTNEFIGDYYQPSASDVFVLTVQTAPVDLTPTPTPTATSIPAPTPTPTPTTAPLPSPTPSSKTVPATTDNGVVVDLAISGNITSSQMSNVTIATTQFAASTTLSFTLTGESDATGFSNVTVPKNAVPYGTAPTIYIDGQPAQDQGYTQDAISYYLWYTTRFSTHGVSIVFTSTAPSPSLAAQSSLPQEAIFGAAAAMTIAVIVAGALILRRSKRYSKQISEEPISDV
jgi:hypothetical protein